MVVCAFVVRAYTQAFMTSLLRPTEGMLNAVTTISWHDRDFLSTPQAIMVSLSSSGKPTAFVTHLCHSQICYATCIQCYYRKNNQTVSQSQGLTTVSCCWETLCSPDHYAATIQVTMSLITIATMDSAALARLNCDVVFTIYVSDQYNRKLCVWPAYTSFKFLFAASFVWRAPSVNWSARPAITVVRIIGWFWKVAKEVTVLIETVARVLIMWVLSRKEISSSPNTARGAYWVPCITSQLTWMRGLCFSVLVLEIYSICLGWGMLYAGAGYLNLRSLIVDGSKLLC